MRKYRTTIPIELLNVVMTLRQKYVLLDPVGPVSEEDVKSFQANAETVEQEPA